MNRLLNFLRPYRKAVAGFITPGVIALLGSLLPASDGGWHVTGSEVSTIIGAMLATVGVVYAVRNKTRRSLTRRMTGQDGRASALLLLVVATLVGGILVAGPAHANRDTNWPCAGCFGAPGHTTALAADDTDPLVATGDPEDNSATFDPATSRWWPKTSCPKVGSSAKLCLDVYSHRMAGGGLALDHVYLRVAGGFWESHAFDCDYVEAWNDNAVVKWKRTGAACDINKSPGYTLFHPHVEMPNTSALEARVCGYPHLDFERDPGRTCVHVNIP